MSDSPFQNANQATLQPDPNLKQHYQTQIQSPQVPQIPCELIQLPSRGLIYPLGHPLSNEENVEIKAMDGYAEDIMSSRRTYEKWHHLRSTNEVLPPKQTYFPR